MKAVKSGPSEVIGSPPSRTVREQQDVIIRRRVTVHGRHIESLLHIVREGLLEHLRGNCAVRRDENEHGGEIRVNHARALRDCADVAGLAAGCKLNRDLLHARIGRQNTLGRVFTVLLIAGEPGNQRGETVHDRGDIERLSDHAGRGDADIIGFEAQLRSGDFSHPFSDLNAIRVAGIGVAAVHDDRLRVTVLQVVARHEEGCAFHPVLGVDRGGSAGHITHDQREIAFRLILSDAAVNAVSPESERRADISGRDLQHVSDPSSKKGYA